MSPLTASAILLACYALGCVLPSYYAVKWQTGGDLRDLGTGNPGATNAGRVLGRRAYIVLAALDVFKGWLGMQIAQVSGLTYIWLAAAGLAVVAGHLWPVQLGFRGGKGMATAYGVILACSPQTALLMWPVFGLACLAMRSATLASVQAFLSAPLLAWFLRESPVQTGLFVALAVTVTVTHRRNLREALQRLRQTPAPPAPPVPTPNSNPTA
jgi:glycerol-3-phosphate acyltransferase PlsY